jgi:hypothetical protein
MFRPQEIHPLRSPPTFPKLGMPMSGIQCSWWKEPRIFPSREVYKTTKMMRITRNTAMGAAV